MAAVALIAGALLVGSTTEGYSLRPWKQELTQVTAAPVPDTVAAWLREGRSPTQLYIADFIPPKE